MSTKTIQPRATRKTVAAPRKRQVKKSLLDKGQFVDGETLGLIVEAEIPEYGISKGSIAHFYNDEDPKPGQVVAYSIENSADVFIGRFIAWEWDEAVIFGKDNRVEVIRPVTLACLDSISGGGDA